MKKSFLIILLFCWSVISYASDTTSYNLKYRFSFVTDTSKPNNRSNDEFILRIKDQNSYYYSYFYHQGRVNLNDRVAEYQAAAKGVDINISDLIGKYGPSFYAASEHEVIKIDYPNAKVTKYETFDAITGMEAQDTLDTPIWNLLEEKDTVMGLLCNKASTFYKGRNYTASYSEAISYPMGPWLFNGLPGLILKVEDDKKYFHFECIGLGLDSSTSVVFDQYPKSKKVSWARLKELKRLYSTDIFTFYADIQGTPMVIKDKNGNSILPPPKPYNPLDISTD